MPRGWSVDASRTPYVRADGRARTVPPHHHPLPEGPSGPARAEAETETEETPEEIRHLSVVPVATHTTEARA
ncbi:hypothetical protein [Streptomyces sp. NPDC088554]|uniref:hypothetical protein n=1 Tax=Streptomyces sp. NPDC088554 TaxID=3365865 RepID=UPI00381FC7A4